MNNQHRNFKTYNDRVRRWRKRLVSTQQHSKDMTDEFIKDMNNPIAHENCKTALTEINRVKKWLKRSVDARDKYVEQIRTEYDKINTIRYVENFVRQDDK